MGLGVLEHNKLAHVPGTVLLNDEGSSGEELTAGLKHGTGKDSHIKKEIIVLILCFGRSTSQCLLLLYCPTDQYRPSTVVLVSGYNLLIAGASGPFICAFSRKYGKRPVYLASTLFCIIGTAVGQARISYNYLLAAGII
ncbi:hypothetical protein C1H76_7647 [Elsinoe australis]|uniref:Major facilitator superfamily (MFS) profile domain-containing protein n=1 Tax=Elsinoe australis TaxID=40998 RepID=A0A4U7AUP2_9PEZI|nr:hypothetical protein C1H76_7647 [Elsinoe australis]